jgi:hypothetical protein
VPFRSAPVKPLRNMIDGVKAGANRAKLNR